MKLINLLFLVLNTMSTFAIDVSPSANPGVYRTDHISICRMRLLESNQDFLKFFIETKNNGAHCLGTGREVIYYRIPGEENFFVRNPKNLPNSPLCIEFTTPDEFSLSRGKCETHQASSRKVHFYKVNS